MSQAPALLLLALLAGCSSAPAGGAPGQSPAAAGPGLQAAPASATMSPAGSIAAADLDGCDPAGTWVGEGPAQGAGTCAAPPSQLRVVVVVRAAGPGRWAARRPDGSPLRLERIRGAAGRCELDVEELHGSSTGPSLVLFHHLADAGAGLSVRDEYEPSAGAFRPERGRVRCTESYDLTVTREPAR